MQLLCVELDRDLVRFEGRRAFSGSSRPCLPTRKALSAAIGKLTDRQRDVFVAIALNGVPIDVLAIRLATNRNAICKILFDARRNLRARMAASGHRVPEMTQPDDPSRSSPPVSGHQARVAGRPGSCWSRAAVRLGCAARTIPGDEHNRGHLV
jgi:hypothetical protein